MPKVNILIEILIQDAIKHNIVQNIKTAIDNTHHFIFRNESYFWITQEFRQTSFLDKMQVRAYTFDDLVGACGGYIGLFLGYTLIQIPRAITLRFNATKRRNSLHETDEINKNENTENV